MAREADALGREYTAALGSYLDVPGEAALLAASAVGRRAVSTGLGLLDMVMMHHACLATVLQGRGEGKAREDALTAASSFLCEALTPYEMTHRGFREISETINRIVQFAAVVCHELRTPLTGLVNSVGMLTEVLNATAESAAGRLLANITTSTDILKARTGDLLDLVGFQSGTLTLRPRPTDVAALICGLSDRFSREMEKAGVELHLEVAEGLPPVVADPDRLEQIVGNLVSNALKYGADGGRIDLRASRTARSLLIEVQDYGRGVSLWDRMRIFQPNYRGSGPDSGIPGLGIGLALSRELVHQHRGTISLESEEGKGSLFRISLPLGAEKVGSP